ncbi:hypothetical protein SSX86_024612 [Deinandra increscens subsp. villosa]|uniref:Protein kinase domain-containing protein n=1 Tax=Deinandra increscens subsp. villosa TaxID=3103831 RepID=A0AAP0CE11_9ASTR
MNMIMMFFSIWQENLGWVYMQKSNFMTAEVVYKKAQMIDPDANKTNNLGIFLMKQARYNEACLVLQHVVNDLDCSLNSFFVVKHGMFFVTRNEGNTNSFSCFAIEGSEGNMNRFTSFPKEGKKQNMNCFSYFQTREGKRGKMNCFPCFLTRDSKHEKTDLTQGKTRKMNCFVYFQAKDSTLGKTRNLTCFPCSRTEGNMNCFSCFQTQYSKPEKKRRKRLNIKLFPKRARKDSTGKTQKTKCFPVERKIRCTWLRKEKARQDCIPFLPFKNKKRVSSSDTQFHDIVFPKRANNNNLAAKTFTFKELAVATKNFKEECLLGEGGFGRVYKGKLEKTGQVVAVKQLNRAGRQGNGEFFVEVMMLSHLCHQHLVNLVGYCSDGDQRLLVYEYMAAGSLENHLLDLLPGKPPLDWSTRIKVAMQAAQGLEYLHETIDPPIIYRDFKSSNILLDKDFNAKLSDFGLAKIGPIGNRSHVTSRVMGTVGYCAPEYQKTGRLTVKSDIYSYGVVLLELITGRRAVDLTRKSEELHLVRWAESRINDPHKYSELVDPLIDGNYPWADLGQVLAIAAMCLSMDASVRPSIGDVVAALASLTQDPIPLK